MSQNISIFIRYAKLLEKCAFDLYLALDSLEHGADNLLELLVLE
jgi:hypothetical protein